MVPSNKFKISFYFCLFETYNFYQFSGKKFQILLRFFNNHCGPPLVQEKVFWSVEDNYSQIKTKNTV